MKKIALLLLCLLTSARGMSLAERGMALVEELKNLTLRHEQSKEVKQYRTFKTDERYLIFTLKLMQKKYGIHKDLIDSIASYIIVDDTHTSDARLALACHILNSNDHYLSVRHALKQTALDQKHASISDFVKDHHYTNLMQWAITSEVRAKTYILIDLFGKIGYNSQFVGNWKVLCTLCAKVKPNNILWELVIHTILSSDEYYFHPSFLSLVVQKLINTKNISINCQDSNGKTLLMHAAKANDIGLITKLLTQGADKTMQDQEGNTALTWATFHNRLNAVKLLYDEALVLSKNAQGESPYTLAIKDKERNDIAEYFIHDKKVKP